MKAASNGKNKIKQQRRHTVPRCSPPTAPAAPSPLHLPQFGHRRIFRRRPTQSGASFGPPSALGRLEVPREHLRSIAAQRRDPALRSPSCSAAHRPMKPLPEVKRSLPEVRRLLPEVRPPVLPLRYGSTISPKERETRFSGGYIRVFFFWAGFPAFSVTWGERARGGQPWSVSLGGRTSEVPVTSGEVVARRGRVKSLP